MDELKRKDRIRARLRRAWDIALRAAEVVSVSPMEDLGNRIDRLEREVAAMREEARTANRPRVA
jgi:polyhydroxyalkanoate synthesis regulator phasin